MMPYTGESTALTEFQVSSLDADPLASLSTCALVCTAPALSCEPTGCTDLVQLPFPFLLFISKTSFIRHVVAVGVPAGMRAIRPAWRGILKSGIIEAFRKHGHISDLLSAPFVASINVPQLVNHFITVAAGMTVQGMVDEIRTCWTQWKQGSLPFNEARGLK